MGPSKEFKQVTHLPGWPPLSEQGQSNGTDASNLSRTTARWQPNNKFFWVASRSFSSFKKKKKGSISMWAVSSIPLGCFFLDYLMSIKQLIIITNHPLLQRAILSFLIFQRDELLRPSFLQEIFDHIEERRLHRWCVQVQTHQVPSNWLVNQQLNAQPKSRVRC